MYYTIMDDKLEIAQIYVIEFDIADVELNVYHFDGSITGNYRTEITLLSPAIFFSRYRYYCYSYNMYIIHEDLTFKRVNVEELRKYELLI